MGDKICIFYLETNGLGGDINVDTVPSSLELNVLEQNSLTNEEYNQIILEGYENS
jgi:hypothetical protein